MATKERTPQRYTTSPTVPSDRRARYAEVVSVLSGAETITGSASRLGLSRVQMQTIVHRAQAAVIESLAPRAPGPVPRKTERERELERENARLKQAVSRAELRAATLERFTQMAWDLIREGRRSKARGRRSRDSRSVSTTTKRVTRAERDPDPGKSRERELALAREMRERGVRAATAATLLGLGCSTLRRSQRRAAEGLVLLRSRQRSARDIPTSLQSWCAELVRATAGQIGAESLRHAVAGVSRREAARVKADVLLRQQQARRARQERIEVVTPGVMRGFDAMRVATADGTRWLLVASDAAVPYRTSMVLVTRYDARSVLRAIEADIAASGAPLAWRMDRASAHRVPDVLELLTSHGVLVLHGPARCPRFYGQLERQNREHRPLLQQLGELPRAAAVERYLPDMQRVLNESWPRRALDWRVPAGLWTTRPALSEDRDELRADVQQRAARIAARIGDGRSVAELANRIAIEEALIERGYLRRPAETVLIGIRC